MKYSVMSDRDFESLLKNNGYVVIRNRGDHSVWFNEERKDQLVTNKNMNPLIIRRLIKHHHLKEDI